MYFYTLLPAQRNTVTGLYDIRADAHLLYRFLLFKTVLKDKE
jgi:hypothetical protein